VERYVASFKSVEHDIKHRLHFVPESVKLGVDRPRAAKRGAVCPRMKGTRIIAADDT